MSAVAAAIVGGSVVSGIMGSNAASNAASTQANAANNASQAQLQATRESNAMQWQMYQQQMANQSPYMRTGNMALSALSSGMGLGAAQNYNGGSGGTAGSTSGVPGVGGSAGGGAGFQPGQTTAGSTTNYGASNADMAAAAGSVAPGQFTKTFGAGDLGLDPSYQFRLNQGTQNLNASAAARGLMGSGQNMKDVTDYGQQAASQEYGAAYGRFMNNQNTAYNRLAGLAGVGQTATSGADAAAGAAGSGIAGTTMAGAGASNAALIGGANASAAGQMGSANALSGAFNSGMSNWNTMQYLNKFPSGGAGTGQGGSPSLPGLTLPAQGNYTLGTGIGG